MVHQLILLGIPILFRQYEQWNASRAEKQKGEFLGGTPSVAIWFISYVVLLILATYQLMRQPIGIFGWVGYAVLWFAILLRSFAFRAIRGFYNEAIVLRENHRVITSGVYRYLRHPLHLGLCFEMIGLSLLGGRWYSVGIIIVVFATLVFRNRNEERLLEQHLEDLYRVYRKTAWDIIDLFPRLHK